MSTKVILTCGCAANATDQDGNPSCAVHAGLADTSPAEVQPSLEGRTSKCTYCDRKAPSSTQLPFFEYKGPGSESSRNNCRNCAYAEVAHTPEVMAKNDRLKCVNFVPHGPYEFDRHYCGCRGWE